MITKEKVKEIIEKNINIVKNIYGDDNYVTTRVKRFADNVIDDIISEA